MKLDRLPDTPTIVAFRGVIDFYLWKGVPVGRAWPKRSTQPPTAGEIQGQVRFRAMVVYAGASDISQQDAFKAMMPDAVGVTWVDANRAMASGNPWVKRGTG
jgi:hypothetical protein